MSKDFLVEFVQIESDKFPIQPGEDEEIVNDGMYGKALAEYLQKEMVKIGYDAPSFCAEDWGWWLGVSKDNYKSGLCIYCTSEPPALKTYAICEEAQSFTKWSWSKFKKISYEKEILQLRADLMSVFKNDPDIKVIRVSDDPWE